MDDRDPSLEAGAAFYWGLPVGSIDVMAAADVTVNDINSSRDRQDAVLIQMQAGVRNFEQLSDLLSRLNSIRNVLDARRLRDPAGGG